MASVYRVRDTRTGKPVALKRSGTRAASKTHRRRVILEREYQILAQLTHPRIIDVYDYGVDTDGPYYTMELLDGADLDKSGPLPWREACAVLRDIASSLAILHSRGVIHRDVSARNVRRTADGRAKLIDFGAMASMGQPSEVVGTAAFMAPEVLQMQSLDGRADLFSLGALGHYLLLGRHAFPVRKLSELRDQWRTRPISPSKVLPEVPPALGQLIVQLLSLDRAGRPQNAAEVMERLCTVAGLPVEELGEISRAYLTMPTLVGRDDVLMTVRSRMLSLVRNDGDTLWIEGAAGSGRSRLLDACVLEGKLVGANLLRADASDGPGREWAVARRLTSQLFELFPLQALTASQFSRSILGQVVEELQDDEPQVSSLTTSFADRSVILRELRDFVLAATRGQRVILAVDDADRIDEPSAALLAAIADKVSRQSLILVLAVESGDREEGPSPLRLCRTLAQRIELKPLEAEQTEAVLGSVFGQVTNLPLCAGRIHDLTHGNPRATMELAQHLVDRGLARYEAGSWLMPSQLSERDLPRNLFATLETRLAKLSPDAREFAEVMCLTDGYALPVESYVSLTVHRDRTRIAHAVDELVAARVMLAATEHDRFTQRGFIGVLRDLMPAPRQRALHSRLADFLAATGGDAIRRAEHLFLAERPGEAIVLLSTLDLVATAPPTRLLERALEHAVRDELLPARVLYGLRLALMMRAPIDGAIESFRKCLPAVLKQLEWDTGLTRYYELGDVPEAERLTRALAWQHQHYLDSAERDQVYPVSDAIRELSRLCAATSAMAISFLDLELVESLPIVEPLVPLSPALRVITQIVEGAKEWVRGRGDRALALYLHVLARLAEPDRAGLTEGAYVRIHASMQYGVALMETQLGLKGAEERAKILEANRSMRVAAWRIRMLIQLNQGNLESARKCSRRAELLQLHGGDETYDVGTSVGFELRSCALAGDLLGVKAATDALVTLAQRHANWQPMLMLGQAAYRELQGDLPGALEFLLAGFALARPARHPVYTLLAASHVRVLDALGRLDEAVSAGESYLEICAREQLVPADRLIAIEFAHALGRAGQHARALAVIGSAIENAERIGMSGLPLGVMYEKRARIASMAQDIAAFDKFAELCAAEYRKGNNPALSARFTRMLEETAPPTAAQVSVAPRPLLLLQTGHPEETNTVRGRLFECNDRADRARCALTLLLQSSDSFQGYLYTVDASGVAPLASLPEQDSDRDMQAWLARWVRSESESNDTEDVTANLSDPPIYPEGAATHARAETETLTASPQTVVNAFSDASGVTFEAVLLIADRPEERRIAAVLAMRVQRGGQRRPPYPLLNEIAELMLEHGDAVGIAI
jgi:tetratricopeptide (TPR) repeat protein